MSQPTPQSWAATLLKQLGIHQTPGAVQGLVGWARAEGGNWNNDARFNPLNTTQHAPGASSINSVGVKSYKNWTQGLNATVETLRNGRYEPILAALRSGDATAVANAIGKTPWGTGGGLVQRTIAATPKVAGVQAFGAGSAPTSARSSGGAGASAPSSARPAASSVDNGAQRAAAITAFLGDSRADPVVFAAQMKALGAPAAPTPAAAPSQSSAGSRSPSGSPSAVGRVPADRTLQTTFGGVTERVKVGDLPHVARAQDVKNLQGLVEFDGKPVAAWDGYVLNYARDHGWTGGLTEGYRTDKQQTGIYNSGVRPAAVPKSLGGGGSNHSVKVFPGGAADVTKPEELAAILAKSPYRALLQWAGSKDPPHFSHPHNGSY